MTRTTFSVDTKEWEKFKQKAESEGLKASYLMRKFVEAYNAGKITLGFIETDSQGTTNADESK